jgi:hypothetical protein
MIRHRRGDDFLLITQHDHAQLSGQLARRVGNALFSAPTPFKETVDGVTLHDCGWPLHDDQPTLNPHGYPLHVLESPMSITMRVWSESARLAAERHPFTGLLVSLHVLNLSAIAQSRDQSPHERYRDARDLFELNKFQHKQVEHQVNLRRALDMRTDAPLKLGLATPGADEGEDLLLFGYHLLKAMDAISLDVCSGEDLFETVEEVYPRPGHAPLTLRIGHPGRFEITVDPWPFDVDPIALDISTRRVPAHRYENDAEFQATYATAPIEVCTVTVRRCLK